ncbi:MFS transporter [Aquicoccus sp. SCR17]|nr:MFS transporter [Carideicomes alvinocaridis]
MDTQRTPVLLILTIWVGGLCAAMQFGKIAVIFPQIAALYPEAGASIGFVLSFISFLGLVLGVVAGILAARIGFRRLLLGALTAGALISLYQATLPPLPLMLASRLVEGLSHLAIVVVAPTMIAQLSSDRARPFFMTLWGGFFAVSLSLAAWAGVPLVEAQGIPALFLCHAVVMGAVAAVLFFTLPKVGTNPEKGQPIRLREVAADHLRIYASPWVAAPALGWIFYTLTFVAMVTILPVYAPEENQALLRTVMPLMGFVASITLGTLLLRFMSGVAVTVLGFGLSMLCGIAVWALPAALWPPIALFAALGLVQGAGFAAVPQLNPTANGRVRANGALAQCGNLGNLAGTPLLLAMLNWWGWTAVLVLVLVCYTAGMAVHLDAARRRKRTAQDGVVPV